MMSKLKSFEASGKVNHTFSGTLFLPKVNENVSTGGNFLAIFLH